MTATWDEVLEKQQASIETPGYQTGRLAAEWVVPPFTILDTAAGYWKERRRRWLSLGIESELGRGTDTPGKGAIRGAYYDGEKWDESMAGVMDRGDGKGAKGLPKTQRGANYKSGARSVMADYAKGVKGGADTYRQKADANSNLTGAAPAPEYSDFGMANVAPGTSIFDPVLCECSYRWFCPPGGTILDPFAGGSVRGIVAAMLGHPYTGVDLSAKQVAANREQAARIVPEHLPQPRWYVGDSAEVIPDLPAGQMFDYVFTCPPYYDLEVYSDDPKDLSNMGTYAEFAVAYQAIIEAALHRLKPGRFATYVVSDVRGPGGAYVGFRRDTEAFHVNAGAPLYNDAVLVNAVGTLAMRTMNQMLATRKLGRMHQNVLVFAKGTINTRDWDRVREAPPDPQQSLGFEPEPAPLPAAAATQAPDLPPAPAEVASAAPGTAPDKRAPAPVAEPPSPGGEPVATLEATPAPLIPEPAPPIPPIDPEVVAGLYQVPPAVAGLERAPMVVPAMADCGACTHPYTDHEVDADGSVCLECEADYLIEPAIVRCTGYTMLGGLEPVAAPRPADDMMAVRVPVTDEPGRCQQCGEEITRGHSHPPFVTPDQAEMLFDAEVWNPADATDADIAAMHEAGLWADRE